MKSSDRPILNSFTDFAFSKETKYAYLYSTCDSPLHKHEDFYEFSLVTFGSYQNEYDGNSYLLKKNSLIFFKQGEQHSVITNDSNSIHFSFVIEKQHFESLFASYFPNRPLSSISKYMEQNLTDAQANYLTDLTNKLLDNSDAKIKEHWANLFLFSALSFCMVQKQTTTTKKSSQVYIDNLLFRLNNFTYLNYSVNEIYKDFPIAKSALIPLFKKRTGYTIVQYHNKKKMEYAAQLLNSKNHSITQIGTQLNYDSLSYFAKVFKSYYGVTPKEYQRLHSRQAFPWDEEEFI